MNNACRVAQLLSEVHHIQWMCRRATNIISSPSGFGPSISSAECAAPPSPQERDGSSLPFGLEACPAASQLQLSAEPQETRFETAGEQLNLEGNGSGAQEVMTAGSHNRQAMGPASMQSHHSSQKRPAQRPVTALHGSRQGAKQPDEVELVSAQHSPKAPMADEMGTRSISVREKSAGCSDLRPDVHASSRGQTAGAHLQSNTRRTSVPFSTISRLNASHLIHLPGPSEQQVSRPSSAGVTSPDQSAAHMRYENVPRHS